ncbi:MAG: site-specific integrase [Lachnospiraceae bacterium]|nr:site-specific integrase [Lachnospiraceae bacterium]
MQKRKNRYSKDRRLLRKGEYIRGDGYEFKYTDSFGKRHSVYANSLDELRQKEEALHRDILDGIKSADRTLTINDYFNTWLDVKSGIRDSTRYSYVRPYLRYVQPGFGNTKLKDLSYSQIIRFYKDLAYKKNLSFSSIRTINCVLSMILDVAVRDSVLRGNPCRGALSELQRELPPPKKIKALTIEEERVFVEFLRHSETFFRYYPVFITQLFTGCRVGEVLALRLQDCDFTKNEISISHSLMCYDLSGGKGSKYCVNDPKTKSSFRKVPMLPIVKEAIQTELSVQHTRGIKCKDVIDGLTGFIFINSQGHVYNHKKLNTQLYKISNAINRGIRNGTIETELEEFPILHNHILRHTFATRMREAHADYFATSQILGHKKTDITLSTYTDASLEFKAQAIAALEDFDF